MEPYDVIVNQPVVIDNVSSMPLFIRKIREFKFLCRMNHPPNTIFNRSTFPSVCLQGSGIIKAGFAGDQVPKCIFPN